MRFLPTTFTGITSHLLGILALVILGFLMIGSFVYTETRHIDKQWQDFQSQVTIRIQLLEEIRQHFGYGGVIHHFKNYVLRRQAIYRKHFEESFTQLHVALNRYQQLPYLTSEESQKIREILQVADKYQKKINLIDNMLQQDKTIAQIDASAKMDDAPALSAMATIHSLFQSLAQQKTEALKTSLSLHQLRIFSIIIVTMILVTILIVWLIRRVTIPLKQAIAIANNIATGNLNNPIEMKTHDEARQLLQAFASMQTQLRERLKKEKRIADKTSRITRALDQSTTSILITDADYNIIYRNKAIQRLFKEAQNKIRKDLPHFEAERLLGANLEMFHKDPAYQRQLLGQLTNSRYATISIGGLSFDHVITPVVNSSGERFGVVIEFHNRTTEEALISELNVAIQAILSGNFQQHIDLEHKKGFFKLISESINQIIDLNQEIIENTMRIFAALANGDLTQIIAQNYAGAFEQLKNDANFAVDKLTTITTAIKRTTDKVNNIAEEISHNNINLSQRLEEQAASLEETATSMEQMTATVQQTADNAKQATQLATEAREQAKKGGEVVGSAILAITEISRSSKKITDIIGVIDEIAFQTNLLALNASVEAARAGEYGRGFAVVASEVRNLAQRSAEAAKEIKTLIQDSVVKVDEGTKLANHSGKTLEQIVLAVTKVSDIIADIAATSQEQSSGIQQVNKAIAQMDVMTQQNATLVEEASSASSIMKEQVQNLKQQVNFFKVDEPKLSPNISKTPIQNLSPPQTTTEQQLNSVIPSHDHDGEWEDF